jgi:hypothetical protein
MSDSAQNESLGKKVFFLYAPGVIQDDVVNRLLEDEYEVYLLRDHDSARRLLKNYPNSIIFINIDSGMAESDWETWIRKLREELPDVGIGIMSYNNDEELRKKYLMDIGAACGFVRLKIGAEETSRILRETLRANEAKGRRKYVRAACHNDGMARVNIRVNGNLVDGAIQDISSVGFSCRFDSDPRLLKNSLVQNIQLKLRGSLLLVEGVVFGTRQDSGTVYVLLFTAKVDGPTRSKVRRYLHIALQAEIEAQSHS